MMTKFIDMRSAHPEGAAAPSAVDLSCQLEGEKSAPKISKKLSQAAVNVLKLRLGINE